MNSSSEIDPEREDCFIYDDDGFPVDEQRFLVLSPCKNNCRGGKKKKLKQKNFQFSTFIFLVNYSVVSGGSALVFGSLVAGSGVFSQALGAILGDEILLNLSYTSFIITGDVSNLFLVFQELCLFFRSRGNSGWK